MITPQIQAHSTFGFFIPFIIPKPEKKVLHAVDSMPREASQQTLDKTAWLVHSMSNRARTPGNCLTTSIRKKLRTAHKTRSAKNIGGIAEIKIPNPATAEANIKENIRAPNKILLGRTLQPNGHARIASMVVPPKYIKEQ